MKPIDKVLQSARETLSTSSTTTTGDTVQPPQTNRRAINRIFATLKIAYPAWYEKHFGDEAAEALGKRLWRCVTEQLNDRQIDDALRRMATSSKFPLSPAEFIALAQEVPGLPSAVAAWHQALEGRYAHEAVQAAAQLTGTFDLKQAKLNDRALQQVFDRNYSIVCRRLQAGQPLDGEIAEGIGHDSQKTEAELAWEHSEQQLHALIAQQGIPRDGSAARVMLLSKLGIKRESAEGRP